MFNSDEHDLPGRARLSKLSRGTRAQPLLLFAIFLIAGCTGSDATGAKSATDATSSSTSRQPAAVHVELALNWFPEAEHGGYFAALVHGYYRDAGLDVKILPGAASSAVLQRVARNQVAFGVENADRILLGRAQQADVIALLAPIQKSPRGIMVHADSGFAKIADISNVTLAVNSGASWVQYLKARGPLSNVRFVPYSGSVAQFLVDPKYAQQAYVFSEPYVAREKGVDVNCLLMADTGYNPYTSVLLTSGETLTRQPEVVAKFVAASLKGWQTYLDLPQETNRYLHEVNPEMTPGILEYGVKSLRPLCLDGLPGPSAIGRMTLERWQTLAAQLVEVGAMKADAVDPSAAFTTQFLPKQ
ncbi:MAG TPA: ABC transporter substrate-binding protein [Planctomycetaceae bacterium]|nr:ABC transporter substrate-binding protein [Planctomycetaceae bacterium]